MNKRTLAITSAATITPILLVMGAIYIAASVSAHGSDKHPELSEDQRAVVEQIHELKKDGKIKEAKALWEESDLPNLGFHKGHHKEIHENAKAIMQSVADGNFELFKELTKDKPFAEDIDEATFAKLVEAHTLHQSGNKEGAHEIMKELEIRPFGKYLKGHGKFKRHHNKEEKTETEI